MSGWQTMETAPKDGSYIIAAVNAAEFANRKHRQPFRLVKYVNGVWRSGAAAMPECYFTHWMHLPDAPQGALPK